MFIWTDYEFFYFRTYFNTSIIFIYLRRFMTYLFKKINLFEIVYGPIYFKIYFNASNYFKE